MNTSTPTIATSREVAAATGAARSSQKSATPEIGNITRLLTATTRSNKLIRAQRDLVWTVAEVACIVCGLLFASFLYFRQAESMWATLVTAAATAVTATSMAIRTLWSFIR